MLVAVSGAPSLTLASNARPAAADARVEAHLAALQSTLDPRAVAALERIDDLGRRLLAARSYLRAGASLEERWSWSQARIDRYEGSHLQRALDAEVARVRAVFEAQNPGYTLWVNPQVRSVELQLERWNANAAVGRAASVMLARVRTAVADASIPAPGTAQGQARFGELLRGSTPTPVLPLAAPGLSRHGRMQAVDFHVRQGERTVAGPDSSQVGPVWRGQGWNERLARAVQVASDRFAGPLAHPDEPWHYEYETPSSVAARD